MYNKWDSLSFMIYDIERTPVSPLIVLILLFLDASIDGISL